MKVICAWMFLLTFLGLSALGASDDPAYRQVKEAYRQEKAARERGETVTAAEILYADPTWEMRMAEVMAKQVMACRYRGDVDRFLANAKDAPDWKSMSQDEVARLTTHRDGEFQKHRKTLEARSNLSGTLEFLRHIQDPRIVRFYGPLVGLKTIHTEYEGIRDMKYANPGTTTPERSAYTQLGTLRGRDKVITAEVGPRGYGVDWVKWWEANRESFGPIPEPLRDIAAKYAADSDDSVAAAGNARPSSNAPRKRLPRPESQTVPPSGAVTETGTAASQSSTPKSNGTANTQPSALVSRWKVMVIAFGGLLAATAMFFVRRR